MLDTQQNFFDLMKPHYADQEKVTYDAVLQSEKKLNNHSKAWGKILNVGLNAGQTHPRRIKEALTVKNSNVAHLRGLRKDHKACQDPVSGPPLRPLCNGNVGPNAPLGNLMARLLRTVRSGIHSKIPTEVLSTEEVLHHLEKFNSEVEDQREQPPRGSKTPPIQGSKVVVGSMDVAALYPNCKVAPTKQKVIESIVDSDLKFNNINRPFLVKFVAVLTGGHVGDPDVDKYLQTPKPRTTVNSFLKRQSEDQFQGPPLEQTDGMTTTTVRKLIALAAGESVTVVMKNHFFQIGGEIYRQKDGAAIGLDLAVESCSLYMTRWDRQFLRKLKKLGISVKMYKRYVDDIVVIMKAINPGWSYDAAKDRMIFKDDQIRQDKPPDQRTLELLKIIANTLDRNIQMETDSPSANSDGRLPVLDLGLWVDNDNKESIHSTPSLCRIHM